MQNFLKTILTLSFVFSLFSNISLAQSQLTTSLTTNVNTPVQGENICVDLSFVPSEELNVSTFRLKVHFDSTKLKYTGIYSNFGTDDFKTDLSGNDLTIIYLTSEIGETLSKNSLTDFLELDFKVLSTASTGVTTISATIDGIGNYAATEILSTAINNVDLNIVRVPEADCNLKLLTVEGYELSPAFSPDVTKYTVSVPSTVSSVSILATSNDEDATVKISRKTLDASGKTTDIKITVTGFDKKIKKIYTVSVQRGTKNAKTSNGSLSSKTGSSDQSTTNLSSQGDDIDATIYLVQSNFNFTLFFIVMSICAGVAIFIIKKKNN